jgi:hypothetical protein
MTDLCPPVPWGRECLQVTPPIHHYCDEHDADNVWGPPRPVLLLAAMDRIRDMLSTVA